MVITEILGGLGNQLSAYACGYSVAKHLGQELVLDVSDYTHRGYFRPYCLDKLQIGAHRKLIYPPASIGFMDTSCIPSGLKDNGFQIIKHEDYKTRSELMAAVEGAKNVYLLGYGGMHYCTPEDQTEIREQFQLKTSSSTVEQFQKKIQREYSVAVHLRRTDFVQLGIQAPVAYYQAAIQYVRIFYPDAHFYFFSDDIEYAKEQFGPCENFHYVHLLGGMDADLEEFFCISACNGRIMTRQSSFSSWATDLSKSRNQINLCQEYMDRDWELNGQIYLNQAAIDTLSRHYQAEASVSQWKLNPSTLNDTIFQLVSEERNDEALEQIDLACLDSYGLSERDTQELTVFKTIALAQQGTDGFPSALRTFYMQLQKERTNAVFHANYFWALYQSGCVEESAIHAALANRYGDSEDYQAYFAQMAPFGQKLYQLLREQPARHYIFIPMEGWSFYITYVKTLAALLARMGQKVTFLQPAYVTIQEDAREEDITAFIWEHSKPADDVYRYHIDLLPNFCKQNGGQRKSLLHNLISQCTKRFEMPTVVIATHPDVFLEPKVPGIKYAVPDICDPLNRERFILEDSNIRMEDYIAYMAKHADAMFLSGPSFETTRKIMGDKIHPAFPAWEGPSYQILDMELDFSPNYISSGQMLQNAAALLQI